MLTSIFNLGFTSTSDEQCRNVCEYGTLVLMNRKIDKLT